jgi:S-DNA-T family DNA segregation ATPase FtsK/SpoIIIE
MKGVAPRISTLLWAAVVVFVAMFFWWFVLAWAVIKRPLLGVPVALFTILVLLIGMHDALAIAIYVLVALWFWRRAHKASFDRLIGRRVRSRWVRWRVYDRRWRSAMLHCGLGKRGWLREAVPKIQTVTSTRWGNRVLVGLLMGHSTEDFERRVPELAHSFGARSCRVREERPGPRLA